MMATKRRRVVPIRYEDTDSSFYTKLSGKSTLSKKDQVDIDNNIETKEKVPSSRENCLKKKHCNELITSIMDTCCNVKNTIGLKEARIKQLEMELVTQSKLKAEFKLTIRKLEEQLSVEMEQTSGQMKEVTKASNEMVEEQCLLKQELELVKEEKISVEVINKELQLEIKKLHNDKDLVGVKNLGDKWVAREKLDKTVQDLHNVNFELEQQKKKLSSKEEELSSCVSKLEKLDFGYQELNYKHGKLEDKLAMNDGNVYDLNKIISKHEKTLTSMKQAQVETQLILKEKTEYINDLQSTIQTCRKNEKMKSATREVDKMIIKQKVEELENIKIKLAQFTEKPFVSNSLKNVNNTNKLEVVKELTSVAEQFDDGHSDVGVPGSATAFSTSTNNVVLKSTDITLETDSATSIGEDYRSREEDEITGSFVDIVGDIIIGDQEQSLVEKNSRHGDLSMPSTSGKGSMSSNTIIKYGTVQDMPSLPHSVYPPFPSPNRSDSPAQTSHSKTHLRLKNINTLLSFFDKPNLPLDGVVTPRSLDNDGNTVSVDMNIISEEEIKILAKADKEKKKKQVLAKSKLKHSVAEVVKTYLEGFYPRQTNRTKDSWVINSDQEFAQLAEKFSKQFREEIMFDHVKLGNVGLEEFILTPSQKEVMLEQIVFFFCVREEVYKSLIGFVRPTHSVFKFCLSQYSESLTLDLTDSHVTMRGSLIDLNMTDDSRLYIRCQIERCLRSEL